MAGPVLSRITHASCHLARSPWESSSDLQGEERQIACQDGREDVFREASDFRDFTMGAGFGGDIFFDEHGGGGLQIALRYYDGSDRSGIFVDLDALLVDVGIGLTFRF